MQWLSEANDGVAKSKGGVSGWRDFGFNLCVVSFPNVYVLNFKLEDLCWSCLELFKGHLEWSEGSEGQRFVLDIKSLMDLQWSPSHATPSLLYLLQPQVYSISITSLTPLHSSLFPLFHPLSLHLCFIDICPHATMILLSFAYTHSCFLCFTLVPLFLVPDQVKLTLQCRVS